MDLDTIQRVFVGNLLDPTRNTPSLSAWKRIEQSSKVRIALMCMAEVRMPKAR